MATKRTITATAPDGTEVGVNVGPKRAVGALRILAHPGAWSDGTKWLVTVHKSLELAVTGSNETPAWNRWERHAVVIEGDVPVGEWIPCRKG